MVSVEVSMIDYTHWKWERTIVGYVRIVHTNEIDLPYTVREEIYDWCMKNKIDVEYQGTMMDTDVWYIKDEQQRMWFKLRWT